jgi:hypothetical protein
MEKRSVFCEVSTALLNTIYMNFMLQWVESGSADKKILRFHKSNGGWSPPS